MGFYINGITCLSGLGIIATSNDFKIILQPVGSIIRAYTNYVFKIECNRSTGLFYQWYKNSVKVLDANTPNLTVFNATSGDNGNYYCVVDNGTITKTSETASLSVLYPIEIIKQPITVITNPLSTVSFEVDYIGSELINVQWYYNTTIITGATGKKITVYNVTNDNEGQYYCILSNFVSTVASNIANLIVRDPVVITLQPVGSEVLVNTEINLNCCVSGTGPITRYWVKDDIKINSTQSTIGVDGANVYECIPYYKIRNQISDFGDYKLVAYNLVNSVTSDVATINAKINPPRIVQDISEISCWVGDNIQFSCSAVGDEPLYYQWYESDGTAIVGQTSSTYSINDVQLTDEKLLYCLVTNVGGSDSTSTVRLLVTSEYIVDNNYEYITFNDNIYWRYTNPYLFITEQPKTTNTSVGRSITFTCRAAGNQPVTYRWFYNGAPTEYTQSTITVTPTINSDNDSYYCVVSNPYGSLTSDTAKIIIQTIVTTTGDAFYGTLNSACTQKSLNGCTGTGVNAALSFPSPAAIDSNGNIFVLNDKGITKINPLAVGTAYTNTSYSGEIDVGFNSRNNKRDYNLLFAITIDSNDNIYLFDAAPYPSPNKIRQIRKQDSILGTLLSNSSYNPTQALAIKPSNKQIYFWNSEDNADITKIYQLKKIATTSPFAVTNAFTINNTPTIPGEPIAYISQDMVFDSNDNLYYIVRNLLYKQTPDGTRTIFHQTNAVPPKVLGDYNSRTLNGLSIDNNNNIYIGDKLNKCIKRISPAGNVTVLYSSPNTNIAQVGSYVLATKDGNYVYFSEESVIRKLTLS